MERCILWEKVRIVANSDGNDLSQKCPMLDVCNGDHCVFVQPIRNLIGKMEKENSQLERNFDGVKLEELRKALKNFTR